MLNRDVPTTGSNMNIFTRHVMYLTSIACSIDFSRKKLTTTQLQAFNRGLSPLRNNGQLATIAQRYGLLPTN
jgi:hypothetical protein